MNAADYRAVCARSDVLARRYIRAAQARLAPVRPDLAGALQRLLVSTPIPKPAEHQSGPESDYFRLDLATETIEDIVHVLGEIETHQLLADTPGLLASATADLLDRWNSARSSRSSV